MDIGKENGSYLYTEFSCKKKKRSQVLAFLRINLLALLVCILILAPEEDLVNENDLVNPINVDVQLFDALKSLLLKDLL